MKKIVKWSLFLGLVAGLAVVAFGLSFAAHCDWNTHMAVKDKNVYAWMQHEFKLSDNQISKIKSLDQAYMPICDRHCEDIRQVETSLRKVSSAQEKTALESKFVALKEVCQNGLQEHLKIISNQMPKEEGARYYAMMIENLECMSNGAMHHSIKTVQQ